ncbi:DUF4212 domain-containing protein [Aurantiacibacter spongiae]|uniref:DUF4212 domain-containing protein n=1 Tax=Aurantiacibacter spongiae TaxID=2488860 RepID=A0A3N5DNG0_9SPHN|nr:DUF4212 domain-containing protein [Aurantiacibacter spongiae]RPF72465.1 DUF4212 domain-containing protein [Aurantiacibacter spongiae]
MDETEQHRERVEAEPERSGEDNAAAYWRANLRLVGILLAIWFAVSFGAGILLRDWLDRVHIGGYPLGFWFAQQGSIYVFLILIAVYVRQMRRIERRFDVDD